MKKLHIITYAVALVLMLASYAYYLFGYITEPATLYMHSFHLLGIALVFVPFLFEIIFKKELPLSVIIGFYIFIFMSQILGSAYDGYSKIPALDLLAHGFSGCLVVFFFAWLSKNLIEREPVVYQLLYLVGVAMIVGVVWEIIEFCGDSWFGMNCQVYRTGDFMFVGQEALKDTMYDLIVDLVGAIVGATAIILHNHFKKRRINEDSAHEKNI